MSRLVAPGLHLERLRFRPDLLALGGSGRLHAVVHVRGWTIGVRRPLAVVRDLPALDALAESLGWRDAPPEGAPPFTGGLVGMLGDDLARPFLDLPADTRPSRIPVPPLWFGVHDTAVCVSPEGEAWLVAADLPGWSRTAAEDRLAALRGALDAPDPGEARPVPAEAVPGFGAAAHAAAVERILGWIAAGDLYQLNLTLQFRAPWAFGGAALARRLWAATPGAAHAAWLRLPGRVEVVSASPETFLRSDGRDIVTRPIKGTRPRAPEPAADAAARADLTRAAKDQAEHVMIVDLERNDLGRIAVPGTVRVDELAAVEGHPTVWHLTSTVRGRPRPGTRPSELLRATFPSGSITGAPKRMAVARTALVEPERRGVYCGAVGVLSRGLLDLSVAIRTAVVHDGVASYGAGGGIVADSRAGDEWAEVLHKAEAFFVAAACRPA